MLCCFMASTKPKYTKSKDEADIAEESDEQFIFAKRDIDTIDLKMNMKEEL